MSAVICAAQKIAMIFSAGLKLFQNAFTVFSPMFSPVHSCDIGVVAKATRSGQELFTLVCRFILRYGLVMKLYDHREAWVAKEQRSYNAYAKAHGWSKQNVHHWIKGVIPRPAQMQDIEAKTGGKVKPRDFYA